ncbi:MAG: bifunctional phosphoribosylaminoimidazolecarboxamide formyltransferase/IMP cyclohydrolase [Gemmatimonadales bacterium]
MPRALISVSDKRGVVQFARGLTDMGWDILSTGGTRQLLVDSGLTVTAVDTVTGFPEMLDGRVKTLHPLIHGAILARRDTPQHLATLEEHGITPIDLVVVNLYPFRATIAKTDVDFDDAIENIDIGGPSLLRSAAKNHQWVLPVVDPTDYDTVLEHLKANDLSQEFRQNMAAKVFSHTSEYDATIARYLPAEEDELPRLLGGTFERQLTLRYGENPTQRAALYVTEEQRGIRDMKQLHGKELSYNNILDMDSAVTAASLWSSRPACAIIKHTSPCGIALGNSAADAFTKALSTDPVSAFGGVVAYNTVVDEEAAQAMLELFLEVIAAPSFHDQALAVLRTKRNLRLVEIPSDRGERGLETKYVRGGFLVQDRFQFDRNEDKWRVATDRTPTEQEWIDLRFAWTAAAPVKSNAIVLARNETAIGIGGGLTSRVDAAFLAAHKAAQLGHDPSGSVLASDGFFPFPDGVEEAAKVGVTAIIQPGGSIRDEEVIAAADEHGMAMVLTGTRQFRH